MQNLKTLLIATLYLFYFTCSAQMVNPKTKTGAERISEYIHLLKGKKIGLFANQTSTVGSRHLVDTLHKLGVNISVIFGPEHGFRGTADAGEKVGNTVDSATGISVVSLYGSKRKPSAEDVKDVDVLVFDIQDVGVRFYTYISSLQDFMEAAFELNKPLLILDRPNPNGFYVDGPVLDKKFSSYIGKQAIPVVYGMTIGEYAQMLVGEKWLSSTSLNSLSAHNSSSNKEQSFQVKVIPCSNYSHKNTYTLPVRPSPNLPEMNSIYWYPSTCFFEGTVFSEGRGTQKPPDLPKNLFSFTPQPNEGAKNSKHYGKTCYGWNLTGNTAEVLSKINGRLQLSYLLEAYNQFPDKENFFIKPKSGKMEDSFFDKLAGNNELWQQITSNLSESEIRESWKPGLDAFKKIRKKYLLYPDFE